MPSKKRLQTKWDAENQRWKVYLSMRNDRNRIAVDILDTREQQPARMKLEEIEAIRDLLEHQPDYIKIGLREDSNWQAIINHKGGQLVDFGLFLERTLSMLSSATLYLIAAQSTELAYNQWQLDHGELSKEQIRDKETITFCVAVILAIFATFFQYRLSHVRRHDISNANREFEFTDNLLNRLDDIKEEIEIKNRVLKKLERFLCLFKEKFNLDDECISELAQKNNSLSVKIRKAKSITESSHAEESGVTINTEEAKSGQKKKNLLEIS